MWKWEQKSGGKFANINRPIAGATHEKKLPVGEHGLQLYSLATPNGVKVLLIGEIRLDIFRGTNWQKSVSKVKVAQLTQYHIIEKI